MPRQVHLSHIVSLKGPESCLSKVIPLVPFNVVAPRKHCRWLVLLISEEVTDVYVFKSRGITMSSKYFVAFYKVKCISKFWSLVEIGRFMK